MMLFIDRPITVEHVKNFSATFSEGLRVEYKANFDGNVREKIAKVVSSFANSQGGVLVIGVNTLNGVPQPPFDGFAEPEREELRLTVENICLKGIYPPLLPEDITVVRSDITDCVFLIIEVDESSQAPHAIENTQKVYVRTGDASNPYDLAKVDLILDLVKRRSNPLGLRNKLIADAQERAKDLNNVGVPRIEISICPTYPRVALCAPTDIWTFLQQIQFMRPNMAWLLPANSLLRVPDGAASLSPHLTVGTRQYLELNKYGLLYAARPFGKRPWVNPADPLCQLTFGDLLHLLMRATTCALSFYKGKFRGEVLVSASLLSVQNQIMRFRDPVPFFGDGDSPDEFRCHADTVVTTRIVSTEELGEKQSEFVTGVLTEITWAFWQGVEDHPTADLKAFVQNNIR
jgi:Putative DNA-binding domain